MARQRSKPEAHRVALGEDLRIGRAREVAQLFAQAHGAGAVEIDGSKVARVDGAGLQAVVAGVMALDEARIPCRWHGVSEALAGAAAIAGLDAVLELK